ncbi:hypothetical protein [Streptomyces sp. P17]|uniref:hypothetical protein n=1 Tax=Streptomyces sp. P17 TaxID=3074716 RepID=UPI0028F40CB4|nr:hypothetical protein [Streptomyces sp. P17]MDT9696562.1 hypothetical protein [Streptomyces sp. P17]
MMLRAPFPLRLWAWFVLVGALAFCVTGVARPAMAMPGQTQSMQQSVGPGQSAGRTTAATAAEATSMDGNCPSTQTVCTLPSVGPSHHAAAAPAHAGEAEADMFLRPGVPRSGVPPPAEPPPPDLHRLCVCRT